MHEPDALLRADYANHAHNDWLEVALTGGLPALLILAAACLAFYSGARGLFAKGVRAFSHGCIRVGAPFDLAYLLLARQSSDPKGLFENYLNTGLETVLNLDQAVPVHLVYFTAWPDDQGRMGFRRDIYGRDAALFAALAQAGVALAGVQS